MVRLAAILAGVVAVLGAASALGAEEAVPGGPPACSALLSGRFHRPGKVDLWVQCNYELGGITARSGNRRLKRVGAVPELVGARPMDSMRCRASRSGGVSCSGTLKPLSRVHISINVNEAACNPPMMRLAVYTRGGPPCEPGQLCPEVGFSNRTPASSVGSHGCGGR
jgi:hypothetical protein